MITTEIKPQDLPSGTELGIPATPLKPKRACMVAYTGYESDNRVFRYAKTLASLGWNVEVIALRGEGQAAKSISENVRIYRVQRRKRNERSKLSYLAKLIAFFFRSMVLLTWRHVMEGYDLIHVHSVPDFEVFAAIVPRLFGAKVILDIHDIVPEFYASKFRVEEKSLAFKSLVAVERLSSAFCHHVIVSNDIWLARLQERSIPVGKVTCILNYPDTDIFRRRGRNRKDGKFIILYPGTVSYHQGVDIAVRAFHRIKDKIPDVEFHIYGSGDQRAEVIQLIHDLSLQESVFLQNPVPTDQIISIMENADLGIVPKRKSGFGNEAFSTKILEFMCMGIPVIVPDALIDKFYFASTLVAFFEGDNEESLAEVLLQVISNVRLRTELVRNADEFIKAYTWNRNQDVYVKLVQRLIATDC